MGAMSEHGDFESWFDELKQIEPAAGLTDPILWLRFWDSDMTPAEAIKEAASEDHEDEVAPNRGKTTMSEVKKYTAGLSDGANYNAGGECTITAPSIDDAIQQAQDWADEGDYPVDPSHPPAVEISLWRLGEDGQRADCVARWSHTVSADACSG